MIRQDGSADAAVTNCCKCLAVQNHVGCCSATHAQCIGDVPRHPQWRTRLPEPPPPRTSSGKTAPGFFALAITCHVLEVIHPLHPQPSPRTAPPDSTRDKGVPFPHVTSEWLEKPSRRGPCSVPPTPCAHEEPDPLPLVVFCGQIHRVWAPNVLSQSPTEGHLCCFDLSRLQYDG